MNGDKYLAATNAFIYLLEKLPAIFSLLAAEWSYCFITKIELLGKPHITSGEISILTDLLAACNPILHTEQIKSCYYIETTICCQNSGCSYCGYCNPL